MKLIYDPSVYVVGRQELGADLSDFLGDTGVADWDTDAKYAGEALVEIAGRVCYMSFAKPRPGGNTAYLQHILESGHGSVLEHAVWSLLITGVSRSLTHELIRHRVGLSYSELSQRYVDASDFDVVVPHDLREEVKESETSWAGYVPEEKWTRECWAGIEWIFDQFGKLEAYTMHANYLTEKAERRGLTGTEARKYARQAARSVLPSAIESKIFVTGNARAWRHFIELRGTRHAEPEIRKLAGAVLKVLQSEAPTLFGDYTLTPLADGTQEITAKYRKV